MKSRRILLFLLVAVVISTSGYRQQQSQARKPTSNTTPKFQYPKVRRDDTVKDDFFGTTVNDPYRWLEDPDSPETTKFVNEENKLTNSYIGAFKGRETIRKKLESLWTFTRYGAVEKKGNNRYFYTAKDGLQDQAIFYVQEGLNGTPRVLIDPKKLEKDGTASLSFRTISLDGTLVAYGVAFNGSDWVTIQFMEVSTGKVLPDMLKFTKTSQVQWLKCNEGVFYTKYPEPEPQETEKSSPDGKSTAITTGQMVYFHKIGTNQLEDIPLVGFTDHPNWGLSVDITEDEDYLIIYAYVGASSNRMFYADLNEFLKTGYKSKLDIKPLMGNFDATYSFITSDGKTFYIQTDKNSPNQSLVAIQVDEPAENNWKIIIPESNSDVINWILPINKNQLVVLHKRDVRSILKLQRLNDGSLIQDFNLDIGTVNYEYLKGTRQDTEFFFDFTSYLAPRTIYRVDLSSADPKPEPEVFLQSRPAFNPNQFETKQVFYKSKDGANVPMFITHRKGLKLNGKAPTLLYGYGGFQVSIDPNFDPDYIAFIQLFDGVVAVANIRGGSEYGTKWYDEGRLLKKQNVFNDFQAAAEYLIGQRYTNPSKLTINGASNGGLLVGACVNQRPDLFGAAVAQVGVMDMLRYHKFTVGHLWKTEYGSSDNKTQFSNLIKYSPLHNICMLNNNVQYPAVLATTGDHDNRVVPLHSYKYIAELQHLIGSNNRQTNPLLIRIETKAGHGSGKPTSKRVEERTDIYSFIARALNLKVRK